MNSNSTQFPKIAIIGGGPGGLLLARLLQESNIPATTYELEASKETRNQGGCLDLHEVSGQKALKAAGLWPEVEKVLHTFPYFRQVLPIKCYEGEDTRVLDKSGKVHIDEISEGKGGRPEIDRPQLRDIMLNSIKPELIQWGYKLKKVEQAENGKYDLHFENGKVEKDFDLVIGADGAWSKVRPLLTDVKPYYSGSLMIDTRFRDVDTRHPEVAKMVGRGSMFALSFNQAHLAQRNGDGSIRNYIGLRVPEDYIKEQGLEDFSNPKEIRAKLLEIFKDWDSSYHKLIELCDDDFILRKIYTLPLDHTWVNKPGLTLLGDAAHLMPPSGEGVNLAMLDALELAEVLAKDINNFNEGIVEYEKKMIERSNEEAKESIRMQELLYGKDAPQGIIDFFASHGPQPE